MAYIEIKNVSKTYRKYPSLCSYLYSRPHIIRALDQVNITIEKGGMLCLLGPNGAGKTTLIKILCSLILPDQGEVIVGGQNICACNLKHLIGFVCANERSFYWRLSGRQNLEFFAGLYNIFGAALRKRIGCVAGLLEIEDVLDNRFDTYSSGIKQRMNIARALLHDPGILFFDDPTRDTDFTSKERIMHLIIDEFAQKQKKTIIFVSHQSQEVERVAADGGKICLLHKGRICAQGLLHELQASTGFTKIEDIFTKYTAP